MLSRSLDSFSMKKIKSWSPMGFQSVFLLWAELSPSKIHTAVVIPCSAWMRPAVLGGPKGKQQPHWVFRQLKPGKWSFSLNQLGQAEDHISLTAMSKAEALGQDETMAPRRGSGLQDRCGDVGRLYFSASKATEIWLRGPTLLSRPKICLHWNLPPPPRQGSTRTRNLVECQETGGSPRPFKPQDCATVHIISCMVLWRRLCCLMVT